MQSELQARAREMVAAYVEARIAYRRAIEAWNRQTVVEHANVAAAAGRRQGGGTMEALGGMVRLCIQALTRRPPTRPTAAMEASNRARDAIADGEPSLRVACVPVLVQRILDRTGDRLGLNYTELWIASGGAESELLWLLLRDPLPFATNDLTRLLHLLAGHERTWKSAEYFTVDYLLGHVVRHVRQVGRDPALLEALERLYAGAEPLRSHFAVAPALATIDELFGIHIDPRDAWGAEVRPWFLALPEDERASWLDFFLHARSGSSARPSAAWLDGARRRLAVLGVEAARAQLLTLTGHLRGFGRSDTVLAERNGLLLRGLLWCAALYEGRDVAVALADAALECFKKQPGAGPRAVKQGNAAIWALGAMSGMDGVVQLQRLAQRVRHTTARRLIDDTLAAAARRLGLSRDDLDELVVPDFGLVDGRIRQQIGGYTVEVAALGSKVETRWFKSDGSPLKSAPAALKREHKDETTALKRTADDLASALGVQRDRIEGLLLSERCWSLGGLRERYLEHPLLSLIARRLIWTFEAGDQGRAGAWLDGRFVDAADHPIEDLTDETRVRLWHPIGATAEGVLAWRAWLERHAVQQPFKQAHREVYLLTDAERSTRVYSNRFAAHIIRQHQFNSLAHARGWRNQLRLMVDDYAPPATRELPAWGLRAEFWVEGAGETFGVHTNDTGTFLWLATDQVRFYQIDAPANYAHAYARGYRPGRHAGEANEPAPLEEIPPLVFSEVMRDVDLFVGVASVGNDPTWQDGGPEGRYQEYWERYSFGDLSATAQTRRAVLERLLPRLKIGDRCTLTDRFLTVRGELRTYKIHLGSGNILMEPNDQYLCIVPGRGVRDEETPANVPMLPFEGDRVLSIILSKAFLLADDRSITDPTITRQIA